MIRPAPVYIVEHDDRGTRYQRPTYPAGTLAAHPPPLAAAPSPAARPATLAAVLRLVVQQQEDIAALQDEVRPLGVLATANEAIELPSPTDADVLRARKAG